MSVTPNFSWPLIEPTDFVTNLPADLETLADAIDATVAGLDVITTAGDVIYGDGSGDPERLPIGTAGQVLAVNSGATAPEWISFSSGSLTQIATGTLSGSSVVLSSIPATYKGLKLIVKNLDMGTNNRGLQLRFNGDSSNNYHLRDTYSTLANQTFTAAQLAIQLSLGTAATQSIITADIFDYANTTSWKFTNVLGINNNQSTATNVDIQAYLGVWNQTSAINSITMLTNGGDFDGGTYFLYGVN